MTNKIFHYDISCGIPVNNTVKHFLKLMLRVLRTELYVQTVLKQEEDNSKSAK